MKTLILFLGILFIGAAGVMYPVSAVAPVVFSWTDEPPKVVKNVHLSALPTGACPTYTQDSVVVELGSTRTACMFGDERLKLGTYFEGGSGHAAVGFAYSTDLHAVEGMCSMACAYSADTDALVTQQPTSQYAMGLVVFRHVAERIKRVVSSSGTTSYVFDALHPDYAMKNDVGRYIWTPTFAVSSNGKWIVAELGDNGTAVVDTDTFTVRQIATDGFKYGRGMDPTEELAISNDGKSVAVTGRNAGLRVFDVNARCGQQLVGNLSLLPSTVQCSSTDMGIGELFANFSFSSRPRFWGDGHEFELVVQSWVDGANRIDFVMNATPTVHKLRLLSLGDSFSSGEGEGDDGYYVPGTNNAFDTCHVSSRAYSSLIAGRLGIGGNDAKNIACSGAKMGDIIGSEDNYWGQGGRLGAAGLKLSPGIKASIQEEAVENFQPGRALQSSFIKRYNPEIITIGIGGNDAGLMGKLHACAMPGRCEWAQGIGIEQTGVEIRRLYQKLGSFFATVSVEAADSRIFVVGYPDIINPYGVCDVITDYLLDSIERIYIQNSISYLNLVIHAAAARAGFTFLDIEDSFQTQRLCGSSTQLAVNSLRFGDDIAVVGALPMLKIIGAETFHPTPIGHTLIAQKMLTHYPDLAISQGNGAIAEIEPSSYWQGDAMLEHRASFPVDFASMKDGGSRELSILIPDGTLLASSIATIEVHSDAKELLLSVVSKSGGLQGAVLMPATLPEGFHTLHLLGLNRAGEKIDMYQFLTIGKSGAVIAQGYGDSEGKPIGLVSNAVAEQPRDTSTPINPNLIDVLGAQTAAAVNPDSEKVAKPFVGSNKRPASNSLLLPVALTICAGAALVLIAVLLLRRWVKRGT